MPESPEITYMVSQIKDIKNKILTDIIINKYSKYSKKEPERYKELINKLPLKIKDIYNIGKRIFLLFDNDYHLILNMGMSGILSKERDEKYNSIEFILKNYDNFYFNDVRKFGTMRIDKNIEKYEKELGYDPLYHNISFEDFFKKYIENKKSTQPLAVKMLDQKIFAGMGNYIRAEVLYDTKIDPFCEFNKVPKKYWKKIYKSYKKITKKSYESSTGNKYDFKFKVYRRNDKKDVIGKKIKGRTLWYNPLNILYKC